MSDPAVQAAQRAWAAWDWSDNQSVEVLVKSAVRELAKSVQELHYKYRLYELAVENCWDSEHDMFEDAYGEKCCKTCTGNGGEYVCAHCADYDDNNEWPCETAKRVYPSEELQ